MLKNKVTAWDGHITLEPVAEEVVVSRSGYTVARSTHAIRLVEGGGRPVLYVPREDLDESSFVASDLTTGCPWKGEARYLSYRNVGDELDDAAWFYSEPKEPVAAIAGHVAFYPHHFDIS